MKTIHTFIVMLVCGGLLWQTAAAAQSSTRRPDGDWLDQSQAEIRSQQVANISYDIFLALGEAEMYIGGVELHFDFTPGHGPLTIDFGGGEVDHLEINGGSSPFEYNGSFITVAEKNLQAGENRIHIRYRHSYSRDGTGLHRFTDPVDGRVYLYTYLWPYYANRLFPAFDQPDLKAAYTLEVSAPKDWSVVSAAKETAIREEGGNRFWSFAETEKFSTYIFSLHAGPYAVWEDTAGDIPVRLFARQSLADYVAAEEWFDVTKRGLAFYRDYFDIPYPFYKYDQLIVPDFNIGAMENVAAVTFTENFIQRGPASRAQQEGRASTILHEMAHMWFGDLVTKKWWNGLWLNESFATYMAALALTEATEFNDGWHGFFLSSKLSAFRADNLVTTHPIEVPVPSTADFFSVFDSITYGKGASVLKQLAHYIGEDAYRAGVSAYLKKHSYQNTELSDFIAALSEASGRDLKPWADQWLYKAGVNRIEARFQCRSGQISDFSLHQTAPADLPTLRQQRIEAGLYDLNGGDAEAIARIPVEISGPETGVPDALGEVCPDLVYPNDRDWGYVQVTLDPVTLENLGTRLSAIEDPLLRSMLWQSLWEMTQKTELSFPAFFDLVLANLPQEENRRVLQQVSASMLAAIALLDRLAPYADDAVSGYGPKLEAMMWGRLNAADIETPLRRLWYNSYVSAVRSGEGLDNLHGLLQGEIHLPGMEIGQDQRWTLIQTLVSFDYSGVEDLLAEERARDISDAGILQALAAEASMPDISVKRGWVAELQNPASDLPLSRQRAVIFSLFPSYQSGLQAELMPEISGDMVTLGENRDAYFLSSYVGTLLTGACDAKALEYLDRALEQADRLDPTVRRFLREAHQQDAACAAIKQSLRQ